MFRPIGTKEQPFRRTQADAAIVTRMTTEPRSPATKSPAPDIGQLLTVEVGIPVAGGRCIARADGRVVFVRGALPGELVQVEVTGHGRGGSFVWAQVESVIEASPDRVEPPCSVAGVCGGCDWQHVSLQAQRQLKAEVIIDALRRTGGITEIGGKPLADAIWVLALDDGDGLGWRTRMRYASDGVGRCGLRAHESHQIIEATGCPLAVAPIREAIAGVTTWPVDSEISMTASNTGQVGAAIEPAITAKSRLAKELPSKISIAGVRGHGWVLESAMDRTWRVGIDEFWQVHPAAATTLTKAIIALSDVKPGDRVLDLYSGVGLFAGCIAEVVGSEGQVDAVEASSNAVRNARRNLHDLPQVKLHEAKVEAWMRARDQSPVDVVVLDPPRSGVGRGVVEEICSLAPRAVVFVACDPVALARDVKTFGEAGYRVAEIRGYDLFPMTKHVESVALLRPQHE